MANHKKVCSRCQLELGDDALQGLCARCLLNEGLENQGPGSSSSEEQETILDSTPRTSSVGVLPRAGERFGDYQLVRVLGQGGMGTVYEAEHLPSERRVALKVLNHALDSAEARKRFLREGQLAASINHPNSIYIFGTDEIGGTPVISMELAAGGTLKDLVKERGPLPVAQAVDVILQVIAGLEAAQAKGILHRDIKPSNCFVDGEGAVKVGDFGLSISTLALAAKEGTKSGSFWGTPAFASPEQIRGELLDVRSDIYSGGATLFYLVSDKPPFEGATLEDILAAAFEKDPQFPKWLRRGLPRGFVKIVLRCLAKSGAERFESYDQLRTALSIFSSAAIVPAPLRRRFLAGMCDFLLLFGSLMLLAPYLRELFVLPPLWLGLWIWMVLYYLFFECIFEVSPGKVLFRLRLAEVGGGKVGVLRIVLRRTLFSLLLTSPGWAPVLFSPDMRIGGLSLASLVSTVLLLASLITVLCHRESAAIHDLFARTRVIARSSLSRRPGSLVNEPSPPDSDIISRLGPYQIMASDSKLLVGYDPVLLRRVWIRLGQSLEGQSLRHKGHPGRLRWLNCGAAAGTTWEAFEAPSGGPLLDLLNRPQPWAAVRYWLADLAEELNASSKDQSFPPVLDLNRIWITSDGRAKLLDFPAPGISGGAPAGERDAELGSANQSSQGLSPCDGRIFLNQVARSALEGRALEAEEAEVRTASAPVPAKAKAVLQNLPYHEVSDELVARLKQLLSIPAKISKSARWGILAACALLVLGGSIIQALGLLGSNQSIQDCRQLELLRYSLEHYCRLSLGHDRLPSFNLLLYPQRRIEYSEVYKRVGQSGTDGSAEELGALEVYIAGIYQQAISNRNVWDSGFAKTFLGRDLRDLAQRIAKSSSNLSNEELLSAKVRWKSFFEVNQANRSFDLLTGLRGRSFSAWVFSWAVEGAAFKLAALSLFFTPLLSGGLFMRLFGAGFSTCDGSQASGIRTLWRTLVNWSPVLIIHNARHDPVAVWLIPLMLVVIGVGIAWAALKPERGLADYLAGTWLVPR